MASFRYYGRNFYNCACVYIVDKLTSGKNIRSNEISQFTQIYSQVTYSYS